MASSIFGRKPSLEEAVSMLLGIGANSREAGDAMMRTLYNTNPHVRRIVDENRGRSIDDLLRERGIDPDEARKRLGL